MCNPLSIQLNDEDGNPLGIGLREVKCSSAWIDPSGKFYPVRDCGHSEFAEFHFGTYDLEGKGWVHLSFGNVYHGGKVRQSQLDTLFDVLMTYEQHGYEYAGRFKQTFDRLTRESNDL
jgi:hypothetical protein